MPKCKEADAALHRGLSEAHRLVDTSQTPPRHFPDTSQTPPRHLLDTSQAGFALDWGEDESGLLLKFLRRGGGYYMSIGASELIAAGEVDVVSEECLGGV